MERKNDIICSFVCINPHCNGYCLLWLKLFITTAIKITITLATKVIPIDPQLNGPLANIRALAPAGGWVIPKRAIAPIDNDGASACLTQSGIAPIYLSEMAIVIANVWPKIALRGCEGGAIVREYCKVVKAPKGPSTTGYFAVSVTQTLNRVKATRKNLEKI